MSKSTTGLWVEALAGGRMPEIWIGLKECVIESDSDSCLRRNDLVDG
ncbi:MAG: hypothetical protein JXR20_00540 [Balneola sp.]